LASIQSADSQEGKSYFFKKRILIVDDESDITLSFKLGLEQHGFRISAYNDPVLALSEFKEVRNVICTYWFLQLNY